MCVVIAASASNSDHDETVQSVCFNYGPRNKSILGIWVIIVHVPMDVCIMLLSSIYW